jgi:hypothetical protein
LIHQSCPTLDYMTIGQRDLHGGCGSRHASSWLRQVTQIITLNTGFNVAVIAEGSRHWERRPDRVKRISQMHVGRCSARVLAAHGSFCLRRRVCRLAVHDPRSSCDHDETRKKGYVCECVEYISAKLEFVLVSAGLNFANHILTRRVSVPAITGWARQVRRGRLCGAWVTKTLAF